MGKISRVGLISVAAIALCAGLTSCSKSNAPSGAQDQSAAAPGPNGGDPAQANLAAGGQQPGAPPPQPSAPAVPMQQSSAPAPEPQASYAPPPASSSPQGYADYAPDDSGDYGQQPVEAEQPPPPLPDYSQPACPGDNYLWTPGYWGYASAGYYWVPGVWVLAPYVGALWTPPYWGYGGGRYHWYHGYWGPHIGFYGGVNYGYGYVGRGYEGGYWNRGAFAYNRSVNNVNVNVVHNVYNYRVTNITDNRVSYNGGRGGLNLRPTSAEVAVLHEQRIAPVPAQVQAMRESAANRAQFDAVNHGRPQTVVAARPLATAYHAPAAHPAAVPGVHVLPAAAARPGGSGAPAARTPVETNARPGERPMVAPAPNANRPAAQPRVNPAPHAPAPAPNRPATENRPAPQPQPRVEARPVPQPRVEPRSAPQPQPRMETRPAAPAPRPAPTPHPAPQAQPHIEQPPRPAPAPQARPEAHPAPPPAPKPAARPAPKGDEHEHPH